MQLKARNIRRIHILASDGSNKGRFVFELFEPLKTRNLSSTWIPSFLDGFNPYNKKGDKLLEFFKLLEGPEFNPFYELRGAIAENEIVKILKLKGFEPKTYPKENYDGYDYFKYDENSKDELNKLYKFFGGLADIVYDEKGITRLLEVKSKELDKHDKVMSNLPKYEILQGKILALLYGLNKTTMSYVFFSEDIVRQMKLSMNESNNGKLDLEKAMKDFYDRVPKLTYKTDYLIENKDYTFSRKEIFDLMKQAYKYAEGFRQTLTVNMEDLSEEVQSMIFKLEKELENDFKR